MSSPLTEAEMVRLWELHTRLEFATKDAAATVATMTPDNYVNHVPVMTGGRGRDEMIEFYGKHFIPKMPADTTLRLLARTVGQRSAHRRVRFFVHPRHRNGLDAAGHSADPPKGRSSDGGRGAVPGRQDRLRAHLLGSGFRPCSAWACLIRLGCQSQALNRLESSRTLFFLPTN